jgi:hypothetical protein
MESPHDVARVRLDNAMRLFDEFVAATVKHPDAATLRGLERRFAEKLDIQPSYWSQIKAHSRQIGERLARQFEQRCGKPSGWMDKPAAAGTAAMPVPAAVPVPSLDDSLPHGDDERFIVGLVLTYYRRHPVRARSRLLDLLGEVLVPPPPTGPAPPPAPRPRVAEEPAALWQQVTTRVAPLKKKR